MKLVKRCKYDSDNGYSKANGKYNIKWIMNMSEMMNGMDSNMNI